MQGMAFDRVKSAAWHALRGLQRNIRNGSSVMDADWYQSYLADIEAYMKMIEESDHVGGSDELCS